MASIRLADPMLPAMARDFGTEPADVSGAITFFALAYGLMQLAWGPLGDRLGKLRVIGSATVAATLGSIACALAPDLRSLELARLLTGVFCAAIIPMSIAWVGDVVPLQQRQATLARLSTGTITGMIVGQVAGGLLADWVSWRAAFALMALVFLPAGLMVLRMHLIKETLDDLGLEPTYQIALVVHERMALEGFPPGSDGFEMLQRLAAEHDRRLQSGG